jgi:hypothetical protein
VFWRAGQWRNRSEFTPDRSRLIKRTEGTTGSPNGTVSGTAGRAGSPDGTVSRRRPGAVGANDVRDHRGKRSLHFFFFNRIVGREVGDHPSDLEGSDFWWGELAAWIVAPHCFQTSMHHPIWCKVSPIMFLNLRDRVPVLQLDPERPVLPTSPLGVEAKDADDPAIAGIAAMFRLTVTAPRTLEGPGAPRRERVNHRESPPR